MYIVLHVQMNREFRRVFLRISVSHLIIHKRAGWATIDWWRTGRLSEECANQIKSNQIQPNQIQPNQIKSNQIESNQIKAQQQHYYYHVAEKRTY